MLEDPGLVASIKEVKLGMLITISDKGNTIINNNTTFPVLT